MPSRKALLCLPLILLVVGCSTTSVPAPSTPEPTPDTANGSVRTLPECEGFIFDEGEEVAGSVVASCVIATMVAHNFGKMTVESADTNGLTTFRQAPTFAAHVELNNEHDNQLLIEGDEMWFKDHLGWVRAQKDSSDYRELQAYTIGSFFRGLSDPLVAVSMLESATTWAIVGEEEIDRPSRDTTQNAWRIDAMPFTFGGVQVEELSLWLDSSYTTLQQDSLASGMGVTARTLNRYYDWGVEEEFVVPPAL